MTKLKVRILVVFIVLLVVCGAVHAQTLSTPTTPINYTIGGPAIVISPNLTIVGGTNLDGASAVISTGFNPAEDQLLIGGATVGVNSGINFTYNPGTGVMTLTGTQPVATYQAVMRLISYNNTNPGAAPSSRNVDFALGTSLPYAGNGHFYRLVNNGANITWTAANAAATASTLFGRQGYLVTPTSAAEDAYVAGKLAGLIGWMGASDAGAEGQWYWVTGPENGTQFCSSNVPCTVVGGQYNNWAVTEPNDWNMGVPGEDYAHYLASGEWNDFNNTENVSWYVIEYGGMVGDTPVTIADTVVINLVPAFPDLTVTKGNSGSPAFMDPAPGSFTWTLTIANGGTADAVFAAGQRVLYDQLPNTNIGYGAVGVAYSGGVAGTVTCGIAAFNLTCTANAGGTTIPTGDTITLTITATPTNSGIYANPRGGGSCSVDPDLNVIESAEGNNACNNDSVTVQAPNLLIGKANDAGGTPSVNIPFNWTISATNIGDQGAVFNAGEIVLQDDLPFAPPTVYGALTYPVQTNLTNFGNLNCAIAASTLTCTVTAGTFTMGATTGRLDIQIPTTVTTLGTFPNPRVPGGICRIDSPDNVNETNEANNDCSDSVTGIPSDLTATKVNNVGVVTTLGNNWTWTITVANGGPGSAFFADGQTLFTDDLPNTNVGYGAVTVVNIGGTITNSGNIVCTAAPDVDCTANGADVTMAPGSSFDVQIANVLPTAGGNFVNPRGGGNCSADLGNVALEGGNEGNNTCTDSIFVSAPDMTARKVNDVGGRVDGGRTFYWTITVANDVAATANAVFNIADVILRDDLPVDATYGAAIVRNIVGAITNPSSINCVLAGTTLTCDANGAAVTMNPGSSFDVRIPVTAPDRTTFLINPAGICAVDPAGTVIESDETNNGCADNVGVNILPAGGRDADGAGDADDDAASDGMVWEIILEADPTLAQPGDLVVFTITIRKLSGGTPMTMQFPISGNFAIESVAANRGAASYSGQTVTFVDDMHVGDESVITVNTTLNPAIAIPFSLTEEACIVNPVYLCDTATVFNTVVALPATGETPLWPQGAAVVLALFAIGVGVLVRRRMAA